MMTCLRRHQQTRILAEKMERFHAAFEKLQSPRSVQKHHQSGYGPLK
jgi:hypothetical protein